MVTLTTICRLLPRLPEPRILDIVEVDLQGLKAHDSLTTFLLLYNYISFFRSWY